MSKQKNVDQRIYRRHLRKNIEQNCTCCCGKNRYKWYFSVWSADRGTRALRITEDGKLIFGSSLKALKFHEGKPAQKLQNNEFENH